MNRKGGDTTILASYAPISHARLPRSLSVSMPALIHARPSPSLSKRQICVWPHSTLLPPYERRHSSSVATVVKESSTPRHASRRLHMLLAAPPHPASESGTRALRTRPGLLKPGGGEHNNTSTGADLRKPSLYSRPRPRLLESGGGGGIRLLEPIYRTPTPRYAALRPSPRTRPRSNSEPHPGRPVRHCPRSLTSRTMQTSPIVDSRCCTSPSPASWNRSASPSTVLLRNCATCAHRAAPVTHHPPRLGSATERRRYGANRQCILDSPSKLPRFAKPQPHPVHYTR